MSQKWAFNGIDTLAKCANTELQQQIHRHKLLFNLSHDNINIQFRVYEQRIDRHSHFDSGTASTIYLVPGSEGQRLGNRALQEQQKIGRTNPISGRDVIQIMTPVGSRVASRMRHWVLQFLLDSPDFDFEKYGGRDDQQLKPPLPVCELPAGRENQVIQQLLPTRDINQSTYEGNDEVIGCIWWDLGLDSLEEREKTGLERVVVWVGDQLTVSRLRGLASYRSHDHNSFQRMDYLIPMFGWFHLQMAFANCSTHNTTGRRPRLGSHMLLMSWGRKG